MQFIQHNIPEQLKDSIESIIYFEGFNPQHAIERVVPTGHVFLLFEFDDLMRHTYDNHSLDVVDNYSKTWLSGIHQNFISISAHQNSEMIAIQFKTGFAYSFLHQPVSKYLNVIKPGEEIFGNEILNLHGEMRSSNNANDKLNLLCNWLHTRLNKKFYPPQSLIEFLDKMKVEKVASFSDLVVAYPLTHKQLIMHFKKFIGVNPKLYHRILRFNEILSHLSKNEMVSWTEIAHEFEYTDQSHFIKEFLHFSGFNPTKFIQMEFDPHATNFFPVG